MDRTELYNRTVRRLARTGVKDPTGQIIALAEEIERYRERLRHYMDHDADAQVAGASGEFAEIVTMPTCSRCHAVIPDVSARAVRTIMDTPSICVSNRITPACCPKCGATFTSIVQRIITPMEE